MQRGMKLQNKKPVWGFAFIILSFLILLSCCEKQEPAKTAAESAISGSFTFFDLGTHTQLNRQVRKDLKKKLGRDAIENRSIINLEINFRGFLKKYFPNLDNLNQRLNYPPGERVEHKTVKLMYRWAQKQNVPFEYVELVFSDYTKRPLLFKIIFRKDEAGIVETLKTKYGRPQLIDWNEENGNSMFWQKNMDHLIVSLVPDQFGNPEYQIVIYYLDNLNQLIAAEKEERDKKEAQRAQSGKKAF